MNDQQLQRLKSCLTKMEPFSGTVQQLLREFNQPAPSLDKVSGLLELDPVLTSAILRLANSPFFGFARKITKVRDAAVMLGMHSLKQIVISFSLVKGFPNTESRGLNRDALWRHCIAVGVAARLLAQQCDQDGEEAFVAGMLHDIGEFIMDQCLSDDYRPVFEYRDSHCCAIYQAEREVLGTDHGMVAAVAIETWNLPTAYGLVAKGHYQNPIEYNEPLVDLVHVADILVKGLWISPENDPQVPPLCEGALTRLGLNLEQIEPLLPEMDRLSRDVIANLL